MEMQGNLGMKTVLQRGMLEKTQLCQTTSRETTGEGKEDGGRVYPRDAVRDASCSTRGSSNRWICSNGHDGQQMAKPPKLPSASSCRQ